ncbi:MAG: histidine kinase [Bacillales bacterium]|jgi:two-component system sensor histidine kinase VicK|nr:histidine kinase [Bacillales bacterium]
MNRKVGFFKSIHVKLVVINILLIFIALQIIGVYFVQQLEKQLVTNFSNSLNDRVNLLVYNVEQEISNNSHEHEEAITGNLKNLLFDFASSDIDEVRIIDNKNKILATSNVYNQSLVGKRTTDILVKRTLLSAAKSEKVFINKENGHRVRVIVAPVKVNGNSTAVVYLMASMEGIYRQIAQVNKIFITGTIIATIITVVIGIVMARTITRPISDMRKQANELAKGNFSRTVKIYGHDEIGQLSMTFNTLTKKLQEARATTDGERRKLSSVLKNMRDGVIATDRKGRIILVNEPALQMLDVPRETIIEQDLLSVLGLTDEYSIEDIYNDPHSITVDYSTQYDTYFIKISFSIIQNDSGFNSGIISVLYDVTDQEVIDRERREFVANVSHELRTPLTTMRSYLEALSEGAWKEPSIAPNFIDVVQNETERMIRLVTDLLQLSKMDSRDYRLYKEWINFPEYFNRIIDRFEMTKPENINFVRNFNSSPLFIFVDDDKITQVLDNIISNAVKYSPQGGTINFILRNKDNFIELEIRDQGVGIPREEMDQIFERFYRVDKARSRKLGGTGLGLAIAKEMVEAHGGNIWAKSEEGNGTSILFTLPIENDDEVDWE